MKWWHTTRLTFALTVVAAVGLACAAAGAQEKATGKLLAKQVFDLAGTRQGLCVHLGCGRERSPGLTAELAEASGMLVHGIALDDVALTRARGAITARGLSGRAMVEKVPLNSLPYLNDLAALVVIEDFDVLSARGLTVKEVLRVTAPGGFVCIRKDGKWSRTVKPRPEQMDEWTHPYHGPDGNLVSTDRLVKLPVSYRWLDGFPSNVTGFAATRAWVIAGGRLFALGINERENLGKPTSSGRHGRGYDLYLSARNAWSGLPLWKINCGNPTDGTAIMWQNAAPLVADDTRVYTAQRDKLIVVDAASGRIARTCDTKHQPVRLLLLDGVLVVACWDRQTRPKGQWVWYPATDAGSVEAFDAADGTRKWSYPKVAFSLLASDGVVYLLSPRGKPDGVQQIVALDLQTGKQLWSVPHTGLGVEADLRLGCAGDGFVVVNKTNAKARETVVLSAVDGHVLWRTKTRSRWTPLVDGMLWDGGKRDPLTGEIKDRMPTWLGGHHCRFRAIAGRYVVSSYGFSDLTSGKKRTTVRFLGARGACVENWVPANGMFYTTQNGCKCVPGAVYGVVAIGPNGDWPVGADFEKTRPVERGPAFGAMVTDPEREDDWPTWRHDAERTGATKALLPTNLKELWRVQAAPAPEGPLASAWKAQLTSCLSAPVIARGRVFVARTDAGQIVALDVATGKELWSTTLGGRIDTPPTIHRGLCLVGCHDGWVYALRAKDGQLAWRSRLAPRERRMVAWGAVESVWPAIGTVLVHENVAYATAGRSSESDGGIAAAALDPATGSSLWSKAIGPGALRMNDALAVRDGSLAWRYMRLDPNSGSVTTPTTRHTLKQYGGGKGRLEGGMIDGTWTFLRNRRAGNAFTIGKVTASIMVWNEKVVVSPKGATSREKETPIWQTRPVRSRPIAAMALTRNVVLVAGRNELTRGGHATGFLRVVSMADGKRIAEFPLDAAPAHDGLAVAGGRVYLSLRNGKLLCLRKAD